MKRKEMIITKVNFILDEIKKLDHSMQLSILDIAEILIKETHNSKSDVINCNEIKTQILHQSNSDKFLHEEGSKLRCYLHE